MADTIRADFQNITETRRDLNSVELGLGRELSGPLRRGADGIATKAGPFTPRGPGPQSSRDVLPHIGDTILGAAFGSGAVVVSTHPGAPVLEYGGTISPKGYPIVFPSHAMAHKAGEAELPRIESEITLQINALLTRHGLT